jgi:hypothetical protein
VVKTYNYSKKRILVFLDIKIGEIHGEKKNKTKKPGFFLGNKIFQISSLMENRLKIK